MSESNAMTDRVVEYALSLVWDHQQLLVDLVGRLDPYTGEWADAWAQVARDFDARRQLVPDRAIGLYAVKAVRLLGGHVRRGNLKAFLRHVAAWAGRSSRNALTFDQAVILIGDYRRSILPLIRRVVPAGPELELVLNALDDVHAAIVSLVGGVYVAARQDQLIASAPHRTFAQLASGATHSLNNLLTAIIGRTQLLLERAPEAQARGELLEIQRHAILGAQMVNGLQDLGRIALTPQRLQTDVNIVLHQAAEVTRFVWRDRSEADDIVVDVVKDLADVPPVMADPVELRHACAALILNAVEAMPSGGIVTLRTERKDDRVLISVIDTGQGMKEQTRQQAFDPFFSTKGPEHMGLGLSLAFRAIVRLKGALTVDSHPDTGTAVTISLPLAPAFAEGSGRLHMPGGPIRILIVDDESAVRDIVAKVLAFRGYEVAVADGGPEGLAEFKRNGFDLVLTDLGMPGMSGWEVAREVKRMQPLTLVVLMTGWAADLDSTKVRESGVNHVIHKPFNVDDIERLVAEAMALREKM